MSTNWDDRELYLLTKLKPKFRNRQIAAIFRELGYDRSKKAIQRQAENLDLTYEGPGLLTGEFSEVEEAAITEALEEELFAVTAAAAAEEEEMSTLADKSPNDILAMLDDLRNKVGPGEVPRVATLEGEVLVLCLSDVHYGARVYDTMTGDIIYDTDIAEKCIEAIPEKLMKAVPDRPYAGIIVAMGGDMIDGEEIYPTHGRHLDVSVIDQTRGLVRALWKTVKVLRKMFPKVWVIGVRGNHGRMSRTADERSNWDNVVYQQLGLLAEMEGDEGLKIQHSFGEYFNFEVNGWRGHMRHSAVPHDGTASMRNRLGSWHQMHNFDFLICGHYHHAGVLNYNGKYVFRNGCIMPANDYAERIARRDPARQIVFGVSESAMPTFVGFLDWPSK